MRQNPIFTPERLQRLFEIAVPGLSWFLITMPLWLSFWHPALVAYIIITFVVYWFYKSFTLAIHAIRSYVNLTAYVRVDWLSQAKKLTGFNALYHVVIIPQYREPLHILERTIENLTKQEYPLNKLIIVLAWEDKDPRGEETSAILRNKFARQFGYFFVTRHRLATGEIAGKSSNMAHAAREVTKELKKLNIPLAHVTVTSCDADALLHPKY